MGLKEALIELDNAWATYYPGQTINGRVHYTFDSPKKVRGITVQFKGEAQTSWSEKKSQRDAQGQSQQVEMPHSGSEEYFQISYYLLGSKTGNEIELPVGRQSFNFTATLPPSLPSSFEGEYGYVRYTVKVTLDRPWKFDQETKMAFTVISPLDLNLNPSYREPIRIQLEKTFCCLCCASAPLALDVRSPVSGYVPGQAVPVQLSVENQSNVQLHLVKIQLRKIVKYRTTVPQQATKQSKSVVAEAAEGPVPAGESREWSLKLDIPAVPPSNLVGCGLIDLDYDFKVECSVSGAHMNISAKKYITIGTVPLVGAPPPGPAPLPAPTPTPLPAPAPTPYPAPAPTPYPALAPTPYPAPAPTPYPAPGPTPTPGPGFQLPQPTAPADPNNVAPGAAGGGGEAPPHQSLYPSLSSPVYQESQYNARNIQDNQYTGVTGRQDFAPRYPTYNIPPPQ